ncbi:MAG: hypothetical protein SVZ03_05255 [Spirochaetota bacterium]|nr:hypothetical protein [Spirochaetota bacterium]
MVKVNCVHCGEKVSEWTVNCPNCGKPVANPNAPINTTDTNWKPNRGLQYKKDNTIQYILIAVLVLIIIGSLVYYIQFSSP